MVNYLIDKNFYPVILVLLGICSCSSNTNIHQYAPTETYATDTLFQNAIKKRAMVVIAHDDDMCAMAGTLSLLNQQDWEIAVVSFSKTPERNAAQIKACRNILDTVMFVELNPEQYRFDIDTVEKPYSAISKQQFDNVFNKSLIESEYLKAIKLFNPTIIFTLDNEMGGYGHPEHTFISQMVIDLAEEKQISPTHIYQSVYTDHMEKSIMERHSARMKSWGFPGDEWEKAKNIYRTPAGMPEPSIQVNIESVAKSKMNYLRSYNEREREILDFFIPHFEDYNAEEYFSVFNREFFRVIDFNENLSN